MDEVAITAAEFRAWLMERGLTMPEAQALLGRSRAQVQRYRDGTTPVPHWVKRYMRAAVEA